MCNYNPETGQQGEYVLVTASQVKLNFSYNVKIRIS